MERLLKFKLITRIEIYAIDFITIQNKLGKKFHFLKCLKIKKKREKYLHLHIIFLFFPVKAAKQDIETERETYKTSREGLDNMYTDLKKKLDEETHVRLVCISYHQFPERKKCIIL